MWISIKSGTVDGIQKSSKLTSWGRLVVYPNNLHAFTTIPGGYSGHKCDPFPSARKLPWMNFFPHQINDIPVLKSDLLHMALRNRNVRSMDDQFQNTGWISSSSPLEVQQNLAPDSCFGIEKTTPFPFRNGCTTCPAFAANGRGLSEAEWPTVKR